MVDRDVLIRFVNPSPGTRGRLASRRPATARGQARRLSTWWIYLLGPTIGAVGAVGVAYVLRGPASAGEATAVEGTPLHRGTGSQETPASRPPRTPG